MIGCRADGLRSLRERYAVVARRACEKPISRCGKRVKTQSLTVHQWDLRRYALRYAPYFPHHTQCTH